MNRRAWLRKKCERELILSRHQAPGPLPFVVVLDHLKAGYNVPKTIRTAHALGAREVHLVGIPFFDPTPAKGTLKQTRSRQFASFRECHDALAAEGYTLFALDPRGGDSLGQVEFPERTAFVLGHEGLGLSFKPAEYPGVRLLRIPQFGRVESMNVSVAGGMAFFEYVRQRGLEPPGTGA